MVEPPVKSRADFPALAVSSAVVPEGSGTESDSAAAVMSNTDIHVEKRAEVSNTETNPVSGEVVINTGCTKSSTLKIQNLPWVEKLTGNEEKQVEQKKSGTKRKKSVDETEEEDAGGSRSKSIHTEEGWITPEDFVKQELTLTDRHWKKDILCHGKTLDYLVKVT
ncbi:hypothetical protein Q7C36_003931 [Tachysurus vachellii]|uniref:SAND domain-containing protein n=1 Tax=Tachysurus vachellii TaxID=175792 RepID=A0AA88T5E7_TACVA|nr:hypothetical protein Q7C36_003931 [Tachysurus vachellii]